jgi:two-component system sensor histidine kinase AtoS
MQTEMITQARRTAVVLAGSIAAASSNDFFNYNYVALEQKAEEAAREQDVAYVILYNKEGEVAAFSGQGRPDQDQIVPHLDPEAAGINLVVITDHLVKGDGEHGLDVTVPVSMSGSTQRWGTVRLGVRLDKIYGQIYRTRLMIFTLGLAGTLLGWLLASLFTRRITVPLKNLVNATVDISEGKYDVNLKVNTEDEVQDLAENFQWMAEKLRIQREALEENLREIKDLKHFSDLVILSMTNGLMTLDKQGVVVTFNRMAEKILAIPARDVLGRTLVQIWGEESPLACLPESAVLDGQEVSGHELHVDIEEEKRVLGVSIAPIVEADERTWGLLLLIDDLTEKRILEDRLRRADRLAAMGTLAAGLAHEIKNPLTAVRAFVQMFPERYERKDFREKFDRIVPRELDRVNELLEDLLDLVRKPRLRIRALNVNEIITQVLETLEPEAIRRKVAVKFKGQDDSSEVFADESYFTRALHNLVLNAIQAMPGGGQLTMDTEPDLLPGGLRAVSITVTDTGPGIPPDQINDIFNPFFTSKEKGTGLGLAVTNKIVEDHGGSLTVKSERSVGTSMIMTLPSQETGDTH